MGEDEIESF